jgi:membrane-associated protease RseP (regulator of RpoE activity)
MLATLNVLPLYPLDGGHFAVALYEKISRRQVNVRVLIPVAAVVVTLVSFLGLVAIILDLVNPIDL